MRVDTILEPSDVSRGWWKCSEFKPTKHLEIFWMDEIDIPTGWPCHTSVVFITKLAWRDGYRVPKLELHFFVNSGCNLGMLLTASVFFFFWKFVKSSKLLNANAPRPSSFPFPLQQIACNWLQNKPICSLPDEFSTSRISSLTTTWSHGRFLF